MSAIKILKQMFGVTSHINKNPLVNSVAVTITKVFDNNFDRVALVFVNLSANVIYLAPSTAPSATNGIYVAANGGNVSMTLAEDFALVCEEFYAIAIGGASAVYCIEVEAVGSE